jgi:hypothetical protein
MLAAFSNAMNGVYPPEPQPDNEAHHKSRNFSRVSLVMARGRTYQ